MPCFRTGRSRFPGYRGREPWSYLRDVLTRLAESSEDLTPLLPDEWLKAHPEAKLEYRKRESEQAQATKRARRRKARER